MCASHDDLLSALMRVIIVTFMGKYDYCSLFVRHFSINRFLFFCSITSTTFFVIHISITMFDVVKSSIRRRIIIWFSVDKLQLTHVYKMHILHCVNIKLASNRHADARALPNNWTSCRFIAIISVCWTNRVMCASTRPNRAAASAPLVMLTFGFLFVSVSCCIDVVSEHARSQKHWFCCCKIVLFAINTER